MNGGPRLRQARGRALDKVALNVAGMAREFGETDASLRDRAAWMLRRSMNPWLRSPPDPAPLVGAPLAVDHQPGTLSLPS